MKETKFKETEVGLTPLDWEVKKLGEMAEICTGKRNGNEQTKLGRYPFFVRSETVYKIDSYSYDGEAIIVPGEGGIGKIFHYINGKFDYHQRVYKISDFPENIHVKFIYYYMKRFFGAWAMENSVKATVDSLRLPTFENFKLIIPSSLSEQQRIATALSQMDELISALDEQINKKMLIKQASMQQLLTAKTRLNGFSEPWKEVRFEDVVARFATGLNPRQNFMLNSGGHCYYVTIKDFKDGVLSFDNCDKIDEKACLLINNRSDLRKGDLLFSSIGRVGDAYIIKETPKNWNINESVYNLRPNQKEITSDFLYYIIKSKTVYNKIQDAITGSTLRSIKMNHLKVISFAIPPSLPEQQAIASILTAMDNEIQALQAQRDKYTLIKQGMMQQLLTGKIRI